VLYFCVLYVHAAPWGRYQENLINLLTDRIRPVIFVPGDGGSLLEAKVTAPSSKTDDCPLEPDWYRIWLNINVS